MLMDGRVRRIIHGFSAYNGRNGHCVSPKLSFRRLHRRTWVKARVDVKRREFGRSIPSTKKRWDDETIEGSTLRGDSSYNDQTLNEEKDLKSRDAVQEAAWASRQSSTPIGATEEHTLKSVQGSPDHIYTSAKISLPSPPLKLPLEEDLEPFDAQDQVSTNAGDPVTCLKEAAANDLDLRTSDAKQPASKSCPKPSQAPSHAGASMGPGKRMQLIRVISFTEALNTLRFGDADALPIDSVIAGYWNYLSDNAALRNSQGVTLRDRFHFYDALLLYLSVRPVSGQLVEVMRDRAYNVKLYGAKRLYWRSQPWIALRNAKPAGNNPLLMRKICENLIMSGALTDQRTAVGFLLYQWSFWPYLRLEDPILNPNSRASPACTRKLESTAPPYMPSLNQKARYVQVQAKDDSVLAHHDPVLEQGPTNAERELAYSKNATRAGTNSQLDPTGKLPDHVQEVIRRKVYNQFSSLKVFLDRMPSKQVQLAVMEYATIILKNGIKMRQRLLKKHSTETPRQVEVKLLILQLNCKKVQERYRALREEMGMTMEAHHWNSDLGQPTTPHAITTDVLHPGLTAMTESELLTALEQKTRKGSLLDIDAIDHFSVALSEDQQALVLRKVIDDLEHRLKLARRRGRLTKFDKLQYLLYTVQKRLRIWQTACGPSNNVPIQARPPNRFTKVRYQTLKEEINGVLTWKRAELRTRNELFLEYIHQKGQHGAKTGSESHATLKRRYETSILKVQAASRHIKMLESEASSEAKPSGQVVESDTNSPEHVNELFFLQPICVPYNVHHHILGNILDQFKEAMFRFGRREFPDIMESRDWSSPESIPVVGFMAVMTSDPDIYDRYDFFHKEFKSLRHIRNSHAHSLGNMTLEETNALLDDVRIVADALRFTNLMQRIRQYQDLLASFEHNYRAARAKMKARLLAKRQEIIHDCAVKELDDTGITVRQDWKKLERDLALQLAQDLAAFALEDHIRRSLRVMPHSAAANFVQRLSAEYSADAATRSGANAAAAVQTSEADLTPNTPHAVMSVLSSDPVRRSSDSMPLSNKADAGEQTADLPRPRTARIRGLKSLRATRASRSSKPQNAKLVPALLSTEGQYSPDEDPSFSFLLHNDQMGQAQDVELDKPSTPSSDAEKDPKPSTTFYAPPNVAKQDKARPPRPLASTTHARAPRDNISTAKVYGFQSFL